MAPLIPGELLPEPGELELNAGRPVTTLRQRIALLQPGALVIAGYDIAEYPQPGALALAGSAAWLAYMRRAPVTGAVHPPRQAPSARPGSAPTARAPTARAPPSFRALHPGTCRILRGIPGVL